MECGMLKALAAVILSVLTQLRPLLEVAGIGPFAAVAAGMVPAEINGATGFFVNTDGDFVSAAHVLDHCPQPFLVTPGGIRLGRVVAVSKEFDTAVARFDWAPQQAAVFPDYQPQLLWEPVTITRYHRCGGPASLSLIEARAVGVVRGWSGRIALLAASPIQGGNSGSPILDPQGAVVGMLVARDVEETRNGFAISTDALQTFLRSAGIRIETEGRRLPFLFDSKSGAAIAYTYPVGCIL